MAQEAFASERWDGRLMKADKSLHRDFKNQLYLTDLCIQDPFIIWGNVGYIAS